MCHDIRQDEELNAKHLENASKMSPGQLQSPSDSIFKKIKSDNPNQSIFKISELKNPSIKLKEYFDYDENFKKTLDSLIN